MGAEPAWAQPGATAKCEQICWGDHGITSENHGMIGLEGIL